MAGFFTGNLYLLKYVQCPYFVTLCTYGQMAVITPYWNGNQTAKVPYQLLEVQYGIDNALYRWFCGCCLLFSDLAAVWFYFGKYLLLISASWFGMCFIAAGAERAIQRGGLELILWFVLGLCGFVLAGGVINRVLQVYKYLKAKTEINCRFLTS